MLRAAFECEMCPEDGASKCITHEPGGVTISNSIALIHPARAGMTTAGPGTASPDDCLCVKVNAYSSCNPYGESLPQL